LSVLVVQASYGIRSKSLGLTQAGLDLTFDQVAIHEIYNEVIPWVAKRGGFKDVDSLALYEGDTFDGANDEKAGKGQALGSSQKRKVKDMGSKKRAAPAALEYGGIRTDVQKDLALLVEGQWKSTKDRKHVTEKLRAAGVLDTVGLKELIFTKALDPKGLPKATFFRGEACELNRRIKDKGGSMFTTSTLESLVTALEFRDLVARFTSLLDSVNLSTQSPAQLPCCQIPISNTRLYPLLRMLSSIWHLSWPPRAGKTWRRSNEAKRSSQMVK
jgi:hypothetical protein